MTLSYKEPVVRDYCCSLTPDVSKTPFTSEEIVVIRAHIADLKSAPNLSEAPIDFVIEGDKSSGKVLTIFFDDIRVTCSIISTLDDPQPSEIMRIQVLDIVQVK